MKFFKNVFLVACSLAISYFLLGGIIMGIIQNVASWLKGA